MHYMILRERVREEGEGVREEGEGVREEGEGVREEGEGVREGGEGVREGGEGVREEGEEIEIYTNYLSKALCIAVGADDLLPYIIYTLILAAPRHVYSNIRYIQRFRQPSQLYSEAVYFLTQLVSDYWW